MMKVKLINLVKNNKVFLFTFLTLFVLFLIDFIFVKLTYNSNYDNITLRFSTILIYFGASFIAMIFPFLSYLTVLGYFATDNYPFLNEFVYVIFSLFIIFALSLMISEIVHFCKYFFSNNLKKFKKF